MAIVIRDNRFNDLLKAIRSSSVSNELKKTLTDYVNDVKNNKRNNDFFDDEFLERVFLEIITGVKERRPDYTFNDIIMDVKRIFPYGTKTDDFEFLKEMFITNLTNRIYDFNIDYPYFDKLFALFFDKHDYLDIINLVNREEYETSYKKIVDYALDVSRFCQNQMILKQEVLAFISKIKRTNNIDELYNDSLEDAKKRSGVYNIDEKTLAVIASEARKAQSLIVKLESLQKQIGDFQKDIDAITKSGMDELQNFVDTQKDDLVAKLDDYLLELERDLKESSDKSFKEIVKNTQSKVNEIKLMAQSLSNRTTDDLLRIQRTTEESINDSITKFEEYIKTRPQLQELMQEIGGESKLKEILTAYRLTGSPVVAVEGAPAGPAIETPGIYIPGNDRLVIPMNQQVVLPENIDNTILPVFDENIPFSERMKFVENRMDEMREKGEIFHQLTEEVVRCVMEGDWVYLWGPSGCGKSYLIKQVARILGIDLVENGKITDKYSVMAYNDPHGRFRATQAFVALVYGKLLSLDEFDNGNTDTQVVLNELYSGLLDVLEKPGLKRYVTFAEDMSVPIHPNFRMISAGNTSGEGENNIFSSRGKIDEAVQERMTPKRFYYDNVVEGKIFTGLDSWYKLFTSFRKVCDDYAKWQDMESAPGIITTRDAAAIAKYVRHNSKKLEQVLSEKFVQVKNKAYLEYIMDGIKKQYKFETVQDIDPNEDPKVLKEYNPDQLAKKLVYTCQQTINSGRK